MIESQLRTLFTEIAGEEPGPPRVDTGLARRRGRTRLHWRRARLAGVPAVAAAAAVIVALAVGTAPARPARPAATGPVPAGPGAPRQFNPLVPYVSFGWLPPGQALLSGGSNLTAMSLIAAPRAGARSAWGLTVYAAGQCHLTAPARRLACSSARFNGLAAKLSSRAPDVRGHRAFWAGQYLVWSYARGGWAWLTLPASHGGAPPDLARLDALRRDAVKIADHVRFGALTPLAFPAQLTGLPARWRVSSAYYQPDAGMLRVSQYALTKGVPNFGGNGVLEYDRNMPDLMINPGAQRRTSCGLATPEIINGYRVIVAHRGLGIYPGQELCAADAGGLNLKIEQFGSHPAMSVTSLFRDHLRLLGTNPADWTTEPIG